MKAFVLSGGGNLGPIQVGALRALLEANIRPQMIVGCSAGALNAAFLARELSLAQVERLAHVWRAATARDVYPGNRLSALWRFCCGYDSFYDNRNFYAFLQKHGATPAYTFGHIRSAKLFVTATHLQSGKLHVFGDSPHDRILDALMASTALTPLHPPWEINGEPYIDGGTVTPLPLRVALQRGAHEIYSLHIVTTGEHDLGASVIHGVTAVLTSSVLTMLRMHVQHDLLLTATDRKVRLHKIQLYVENPPGMKDFSQVDRLITAGYKQTVDYLQRSQPTQAPTTTSVWRSVKSLIQRSPAPQSQVQPRPHL